MILSIFLFAFPADILAVPDTLWRRQVDSYGAIIRGDTARRELSLVLTGDAFADGGKVIRKTLRRQKVSAAFFLTGNFYGRPEFASLIRRLKSDGHYLGAHSDEHLLYCDWTNRDSLLVSESQFKADLLANYRKMELFGIEAGDAHWFLPPYEWYNQQIAEWTSQMGLELINFTPGTRSHADYTYPAMGNRYVSSTIIFDSILEHEERDPHGLNGFMLLIHIGTDPRRDDKFYDRLDDLITTLKGRGYRFVRLPELLRRYDLHHSE